MFLNSCKNTSGKYFPYSLKMYLYQSMGGQRFNNAKYLYKTWLTKCAMSCLHWLDDIFAFNRLPRSEYMNFATRSLDITMGGTHCLIYFTRLTRGNWIGGLFNFKKGFKWTWHWYISRNYIYVCYLRFVVESWNWQKPTQWVYKHMHTGK